MGKKAPKTEDVDVFVKNPKWEAFCRCYTQNQALFGNATHSYAEAYGYKLDTLPRDDAVYEEIVDEDTGEKHKGKMIKASSYTLAENVCAVEGGRLLRTPQIQARITKLLNELMTDEYVDSQLVKVVTQDEDRGPKVQAIKLYAELKQRIVKKSELTGANGGPIVIDDNTKAKSKSALQRFLSGN